MNYKTYDSSNTYTKKSESIAVPAKFKINDDGIQALIKQNMEDDETESYYFYGITKTPIIATLFLGVFAILISQKRFICNVTNKGIHFYGLNIWNKPKDYFFVPKSAIKKMKVGNELFGFQKSIEISYEQGENKYDKQKGKMEITANKKMRGVKEQGINLEIIAKMF